MTGKKQRELQSLLPSESYQSWEEVPPLAKGKENQATKHHKMRKYTAPEKDGSKQKKALIEKGHTTLSPVD